MLDVNEALSLTDLFIQKIEFLQSGEEITTLQKNMVLDFTERVAFRRDKY